MERTIGVVPQASENAQPWEVAPGKGSDDLFILSASACHFLDVGAALDDIMRPGRQGDPPHGRKPFTLKCLSDSGR